MNVLANWKHNYTLETVLVELRRCAPSAATRVCSAENRASDADVLSNLQGYGNAGQPKVATTRRRNSILTEITFEH